MPRHRSNYFDLDSEHRPNVDHVPLNYKRKRKMNLDWINIELW